jgi:hypothetical protein
MKLLINFEELRAKKSRESIPCKCYNCENTFDIPKNVVQRVLKGSCSKGKYCSPACKREAWAAQFEKVNCLHCNNEFNKNLVTKQSFCSRSCSASFNNKNNRPDLKQQFRPNCKNCGSKCKNKNAKCCSHKCNSEFCKKEYIKRWKEGLEQGFCGKTCSISSNVRQYLLEKHDLKCCKCGWGKINLSTGKIPLQVHHIDGNAKNCKENNLELLCPSCHSLTDNFGRLNKKGVRERKY